MPPGVDHPSFAVRPLEPGNHTWVLEAALQWDETDYIVSRGRIIHPAELPGFCVVRSDGRPLGLTTYQISADQCRLVTLLAFSRFNGVGTALVRYVRDAAATNGCRRLWLTTSNDNLDALRFYQRRGFELVAVHRDSGGATHRLHPCMSSVGEYGIPIRSEIELEMLLE